MKLMALIKLLESASGDEEKTVKLEFLVEAKNQAVEGHKSISGAMMGNFYDFLRL